MNEKKEEIDKTLNVIKNIEAEARRLAADRTFEEYAKIFKSEAVDFSSFGFDGKDKIDPVSKKSKPFYKRQFNLGSAQIWLMVAVMLSALLVCAIFDQRLNTLLPIDKNNLIATIFTRVLAITIWLYLITFSFKQFSINKHLATINRHRSNALNSYKLFMNTISESDTNAHNTLMLTVAKAIYDQGSTGYLPGKSQENSSILELTKIIGGGEKHT